MPDARRHRACDQLERSVPPRAAAEADRHRRRRLYRQRVRRHLPRVRKPRDAGQPDRRDPAAATTSRSSTGCSRFRCARASTSSSTRRSSGSSSGDDGTLHVAMTGCDDIHADEVLFATGRRPNTEDMGLEEAGVELGDKGADQGRCRQPHLGAVDLRGRRRHRSRAAHAGGDPRGAGVRRHLLRQQAAPGRLWLHPVRGVQPSAARRRGHDRGRRRATSSARSGPTPPTSAR